MTPVKVRKTLLTKSHDPPAAVKWSLAHRWSTRIKEKQKSTGAVVKQRVRTLSLQRCRSLQGCQSLHRCRSFEGCRSFQGSLDPWKVSKLFARKESILFQCKHCSEGVRAIGSRLRKNRVTFLQRSRVLIRPTHRWEKAFGSRFGLFGLSGSRATRCYELSDGL